MHVSLKKKSFREAYTLIVNKIDNLYYMFDW